MASLLPFGPATAPMSRRIARLIVVTPEAADKLSREERKAAWLTLRNIRHPLQPRAAQIMIPPENDSPKGAA